MGRKYKIYGMGNALVDYEIETTPEELQQLGVEKGVMTLIEEDRQQALLEAFHGKHHSRACGGSAANTIIGAQSLGAQCFYSCKVADDETGHFYRDDLLSYQVDSNLAKENLESGKTGKCLVMVTEDADRTMNTFLGITGNIGFAQIDQSALENAEILYIEGYLASSPVAVEGVKQARKIAEQAGVKIAISLSDPNMVKFCREGLEQMIGQGVDILFCNEDEALSFTQQPSVDDALPVLHQQASLVIVTLGANGALISTGTEQHKIAGHSVKAVDTNGAGDLFAGAFLAALSQDYSLAQAGQIASFASAQLVTQFGPRLTANNLAKVKDFAATCLQN